MLYAILAAVCALFTAAGLSETAKDFSVPNLLLTLAFAMLTILFFRLWRGRRAKKRCGNAAPREKRCDTAAPKNKRCDTAAPDGRVTVRVVPDKTEPEKDPAKPATNVTVKRNRTVYEGKVVGVTFEGRQRILARVKRYEDNGDYLDYSLEVGEYNGKPSIKVMVEFPDTDDPKQMGFIAASDVKRVLPYVDEADVLCEVYGGPDFEGDDHYYGASVTLVVME